MWNLNLYKSENISYQIGVSIEPVWNLNDDYYKLIDLFDNVSIEPVWNLNLLHQT